jgi:mycothiol synthase
VNVRRPTWDDFDEVLELVTAADLAAVGETEWTEQGLRSEWEEFRVTEAGWVIELDGRIAGFVTFDDRGGGRLIADGYVHPEVRGRGVGSELLRVTEEHGRREAERHAPDVRVHLQHVTLLADDCTPNLFLRNGYVVVQHQFRMLVELEAEPDVPDVAGIEIRLFRDPEERRAVHAVLDEAFDTGPPYRRRSFEEWAPRVLGRAAFDPSLVWVALDGDTIVGANVCGWKEWGDWGWVEAVGVLPSHRRGGIGDALLRTAFAEFWRRGERRVALNVRADNPTGATRLYERAGMTVASTVVLWEKELRAAA